MLFLHMSGRISVYLLAVLRYMWHSRHVALFFIDIGGSWLGIFNFMTIKVFLANPFTAN